MVQQTVGSNTCPYSGQAAHAQPALRLLAAIVGLVLCAGNLTPAHAQSAGTKPRHQKLDSVLNRLADQLPECSALGYPVECEDGEELCAECMLPGETVLGRLTPDTFRQVSGMDFLATRTVEDAQNTCLAAFPCVDPVLPGSEDAPDAPVGILDCYRGSMGEAVMEIRGLVKDMEIAESEYDDLFRAYDIGVRRCASLASNRAYELALVEICYPQHSKPMILPNVQISIRKHR